MTTLAPVSQSSSWSRAAATTEKSATAAAGANSAAQCSCGEPAVVCVLERYQLSKPSYRWLCSACDATWVQTVPAASGEVHRMSLGGVLIFCGAALGFAALFADLLSIRTTAGFGLFQSFAVGLGIFGIGIGAFLRVDSIGIAGTAAFFVGLFMDMIGPLGTESGIGWRQQLAIAAAISAILLGSVLRARQGQRRAASQPASKPDLRAPVALSG